MGMSDNSQYIPKYISQVPWYRRTGQDDEDGKQTESARVSLAHQYKDPHVKVDHSEPTAGRGVTDEFVRSGDVEIKKAEEWDAKRDRWHGYDIEEWDRIARNWDAIKRGAGAERRARAQVQSSLQSDSDDTDYELELRELGLSARDVAGTLKEDPLEKILRDRQDVPQYILAISASGKLKIDDPNLKHTQVTNDQAQFVRAATGTAAGRPAGGVDEIQRLQQFAWEQNETLARRQQQHVLDQRLKGDSEVTVKTDIDLNLHANPTAMLLRERKQRQQEDEAKAAKRQKLADMYG